jgi:hypothetical protein
VTLETGKPKGWVYAKDEWGDPTYVHPDDVEKASAEGYEIKGEFGEKVDNYVEENKGLKGRAKVFLGQMADEFALGVPELIYDKTKTPLEVAQKEALKKQYSAANIAGGVTGFGAGLVVGAPLFKGAAAVGEKATEGVAKILGAKAAGEVGKTTLKNIAKNIVAKGAGTGVEGAILSSPYAFTEAALGDPDDAAETLMFGVGVGSLFGGGGALLSGARKLTSESKIINEAQEKISKALKESKDLKGMAEDKALEALNPNLGQRERLKALEEVVDDLGETVTLKPTENLKVIGRDLLDNDIVTAFGSKQDMYDKLSSKTAELRDSIGKTFDELDAKFQPLIKTEDIVNNVRKAIDENPYFGTAAFKPYKERLEKQYENLLASGETLTLRQANREKAAFQEIAQSAYKSMNAGMDISTAKLIAEIPKEINKTIRSTVKSLDPEVSKELMEKQRLLGNLTQAEKIAEKSAAREAVNNDFSLTSIITGAGGATAGAVLGGAPVAIGLGLAGLLGRQIARKYGDQFLATALNKNMGLAFAEKAMARAQDKIDNISGALTRMSKNQVNKKTASVDAFNRMFRPENQKEEKMNRAKQLETARAKLSEWVMDPDTSGRKTAELVSGLESTGAPKIAASLNQKMNTAVTYLLKEIPKPTSVPTPFHKKVEWKPSDYEVHEFMNKVAVVEDPFVVIDALEDGTLSKSHMSALKEVYPKIYEYIVDRVMKEAINNPVELPYDKRIKLSLIMGAPIDPSLKPDKVQYYQETFKGKEEPSQGQLPGQVSSEAFKADVQLPELGSFTERLTG